MNVIHDKRNRKFVLPLDNEQEARVEYVLKNETTMLLTHSYVPISFRGTGVGKELVLKTFQQLTDEGFVATPICSYIRAVAVRSDKWKDIIK